MVLKKVVIKVVSDISNNLGWAHLCYVDEDLYNNFLNSLNISSLELSGYLRKWVKQDFKETLTIEGQLDIYRIRELVKERFKKENPSLYLPSQTDRQGCLRAWITDKMLKEIKNNE